MEVTMSDLRKLMAGDVDEGKRKEIQSKLDHFEIRDLGDVGPVRSLATLLGVCKSVIELRKELYGSGFLREVPVEKVIASIGGTGGINPYNKEAIVGREGVERTRGIVVASQEFDAFIREEYPSLFKGKPSVALNNFLGISPINPRKTLQKWLFEHGYYDTLPIDVIFADLTHAVKYHNPYFDSRVVGEDNVRKFKEEIADSKQLDNYVCDKFNSLIGMMTDFALAGLFGWDTTRLGFKKAMFEMGFFTEIPVADVLANLSKDRSEPNPYMNPKVVGEEMVEHYRRVIINSDEFAQRVCSRYSSLGDIVIRDAELAFILDTSPLRYKELRKALFEVGLLTEIPYDKAEDYINSIVGVPYFDEAVVGDMVESYRVAFTRSKEFKEALYSMYPTLDSVPLRKNLSVLLGVNFRQSTIRRKLYDEGFYPEPDIEEVIERLDGDLYLGAHFDRRMVGDDAVNHKAGVVESEEFRDYITNKYDSLLDIPLGGKLSNLFGQGYGASANTLRKEFYNLGVFTEIPLDRMEELVGSRALCPYLNPLVVGDDVEKNRQVILGSPQFREYLHSLYPTPEDLVTTHRSLARVLEVEDKILVLRQALVDGGYYG